MDAGFLHGPADHIVADVPGAGEEIAQVACVHGPDSGDGIALDAGNLHQTADGVAGEAQMVLHGYFSGILHLVQILLVQLCRAAAAMEQAVPIFAWQPHSARRWRHSAW